MGVKTYDPKAVIITFKGIPLSGFADGEFVSVVPSSERFTKIVGADGDVSRSKSNDKTHEVSITLQQTSLSNDYLSSQVIADDVANLGKGPLKIADLNGTTVWLWTEAWIRQPPDSAFDKTITERTWVFDTGQVTIENYGSNL